MQSGVQLMCRKDSGARRYRHIQAHTRHPTLKVLRLQIAAIRHSEPVPQVAVPPVVGNILEASQHEVEGMHVLGPPACGDEDYRARWLAATRAALEG